MTAPDVTNGIFELCGSVAAWCNAGALYRDKGYAGTRLPLMGFFWMWGFWNMFYYPHLHQMASFLGGCSLSLANTACLVLMLKYGKLQKAN